MAMRWKKDVFSHLHGTRHEVLTTEDGRQIMIAVELRENGAHKGWYTHTLEKHLPAFDSLKNDIKIGRQSFTKGPIATLDEAKDLAKRYAMTASA